MMKALRQYFALLALTPLVLAVPGCGTPRESGTRPASFGNEQHQSVVFLDRSEYSDRLGLVMRDALTGHGFSIPWIAVKGSGGSLWFVAERFQSEHRFDRINVNVTPDERVTASITPYQFVGSDWAILGRLFVDSRPEAELIAGEIASKLGRDKNADR